MSREDVQSLQKMIRNEDQFDMMFMESLRESEVNQPEKFFSSSDKKQDFYHTKQQITVGNRQFEFLQDDAIFKLKQSPFIKEFGLQPDGDEQNLKKKLQGIYPEKLPSCFSCGKDVCGGNSGSKKVKIDACHFCTKWGCEDCVYKSYPFPRLISGATDYQRGRICRVCETKFFIKNVRTPHLADFELQKLDEIFKKIETKDKQVEADHKELNSQQSQLDSCQQEIEKLKNDMTTQRTEHEFKLQQIRARIAEVRAKITKQEKEQQHITQRISQKKEEQEKFNNRRDQLIQEINVT